MSMLEFPTFEEMVAVMNSPSSPPSPMDHAEYLSSEESTMEMSAEDMIRETLLTVRKLSKQDTSNPGMRGGIADAILMDNVSQS